METSAEIYIWNREVAVLKELFSGVRRKPGFFNSTRNAKRGVNVTQHWKSSFHTKKPNAVCTEPQQIIRQPNPGKSRFQNEYSGGHWGGITCWQLQFQVTHYASILSTSVSAVTSADEAPGAQFCGTPDASFHSNPDVSLTLDSTAAVCKVSKNFSKPPQLFCWTQIQ